MTDERDTHAADAGAGEVPGSGSSPKPTPAAPASAAESSPDTSPAPASQTGVPGADIAPAGAQVPSRDAPRVSVKTNVKMRVRQVDASGKVTQVDVDPKSAKRLIYGGLALLALALVLIIIATLLLVGRLFT